MVIATVETKQRGFVLPQCSPEHMGIGLFEDTRVISVVNPLLSSNSAVQGSSVSAAGYQTDGARQGGLAGVARGHKCTEVTAVGAAKRRSDMPSGDLAAIVGGIPPRGRPV